jgi:hypothetical protein
VGNGNLADVIASQFQGALATDVKISPLHWMVVFNFLSKDYTVKASVGHIRDLPPHEMGVDMDNDFRPKYVIEDHEPEE